MNHADKAEQLFTQGYNCSQAVFGAFAEEARLSLNIAMKLSSSFGGGMGRLREVCGAVCGMFMASGLLYGYATPDEGTLKAEHYALIRCLAESFRAEHGSIICREILGKRAEIGGMPEKRTQDYYASRPCVHCVRCAAEILEKYIMEHPVDLETTPE